MEIFIFDRPVYLENPEIPVVHHTHLNENTSHKADLSTSQIFTMTTQSLELQETVNLF